MAKNAGAMKEYMFRMSETLGFDDMFDPEFTAFLEWLQEQPGYSVAKTQRPVWLKKQYGYWRANRQVGRVASRWLAAREKTALSDVAKTILDQMGGWRRLKMMIGVQQVTDLRTGVGFKWPSRHRSKGNYVEIKLTPADLYDMAFFNVSIRGKKKVKEFKGLYNDMLVDTFEGQTGWYLRMGSENRVAARWLHDR